MILWKVTWMATKKYILFSSITIVAVVVLTIIYVVIKNNANINKLNSTYNEFNLYSGAINKFYDTYGYFPGDFPNASDLWSDVNNGNGDGKVEEFELEDIYAWQHLSLAGLLEKQYNGKTDYTNRQYVGGKNVPQSPEFDNSLYVFKYIDNIYGNKGHALIFARPNERGYPVNGVVSSEYAANIDHYFDDKLPFTGDIVTIAEDGSKGCVKVDSSGYSANYLWTDEPDNCVIYYWILKENG